MLRARSQRAECQCYARDRSARSATIARLPPSRLPPRPSERTAVRRALFLVFVSAVAFGAMAFAGKLAMARLAGAQVAFIRFALMLAPFAVAPRLWRRALTFERPDLLIYRGVFGGVAVLLYFLAIAHIPVGIATLFNYSSPVFSGIFAAWFLGEAWTARRGVPVLVALAGVALVVGAHAQPGEILAIGPWEAVGLASGVLSGAAVTAIRAARRTEGSWAIYGSFTLGGLLATAPFCLWHWQRPTAREWLWLGAVGGLSVLAQLAMTHAYRWVDNLRAGVFSPFAVVVAMALGAIFLGETTDALTLAGSALAIGGVLATLAFEPRPAAGAETA